MSESKTKPIKTTSPASSGPKGAPLIEGVKSSFSLFRKGEPSAKSSQPIKITPGIQSSIEKASEAKKPLPVDEKTVSLSGSTTPLQNSVVKVELKSESTQRMGNWFKSKKKEELPPTPPKVTQKEGDFPWIVRERDDESFVDPLVATPPPVVLPLATSTPPPVLPPPVVVSPPVLPSPVTSIPKKSIEPIPAKKSQVSEIKVSLTTPVDIIPLGSKLNPLSDSLPISAPVKGSEKTPAEKSIQHPLKQSPKQSIDSSSPPAFLQSSSPSPLLRGAEAVTPSSPGLSEKTPPPPAEENSLKPDLLSRKRYEEKGLKAEAPSAEPKPKKPFPLWLRIILWILIPASISGIGYATYLHKRETKLEGKIVASSFRFDKKILIVNDFSADLKVLAGEYQERLQPVRDQIKDREGLVRRARGDCSSVEERVRIIEQERGSVQKEIDLQIETGKAFQKKLWETEGPLVEKEYEKRLDLFHHDVQERVKALQLKWEPGEIRAPEVWANAFRLGLYDAPKAVKSSLEREWIEKELQKWREFETKWETRKEEIRDRIDAHQEKINEKVIALKDRAQLLEIKVNEAQQELDPLKMELAHAEGELKEAQAEEKSFFESYYKQIMELPEKNIRMTLDLRADQTFSWKRIQENKAFPAGKYGLFVKGKKGDNDYWTMVEITLVDFHKTEIEIQSSAFVSVQDYLRK